MKTKKTNKPKTTVAPEMIIRSFRVPALSCEILNLLGVDINVVVRDAVNKAAGVDSLEGIELTIKKLKDKLEG